MPAAVEFGDKCGMAVKFGISSWGDDSDIKSDYDGGFTVVYGHASFYCALL